ncbi:Na+/H+ antiporter NhaA [Prauserella sp. PE36]|uniref:Na(+)/H(+) antiporter NhaA n=1 Tax=Prauserella endophytica TaxID=1592324 RepID=A0ABY2S395_9PSEU|nr:MULTISPECIES: Na+/H+ antiporter NhaA [Prauserella]PXY34305.1 Na+/H+ antiporter NhaA [Prauserella coralliicola]RBM23069.1 Na+/H+ antiporter NhaA [Prauserella sp. PE36]TKG70005.1 Na+/H+ antiporter NhaA [Prauserella endophytica]
MNTSRRPAQAVSEFARFLRVETTGGMLLLAATAIALLWANSPLDDVYRTVRDFRIGPESLHLNLSIGDWAKDGLLAVFFFVAGLELKRELVVGELSNLKSAALPIIAAAGGMIAPALIAVGIAWGEPGIEQAWAIPVATDIAFALGVLALTGSNLPTAARVFLLSLAVVDDLGAIIVIAALFTESFSLVAAAIAVSGLACYAYLQHRRVRAWWIYVPLALVVWASVHAAGVHATIAGVALGLLTRVRADRGEHEAPALRLEHRLQPWSAGFAVPMFALFAAGIAVSADALSAVFTSPIPLAVMAGLLGGKLVGILGFSALAVRLGIARLPGSLTWLDIGALSMLGAVGFTVSLLIAELSLEGEAAELAKAAVLIASAVASLTAALLLIRRSKVHASGAPTEPSD